jgi:hypothetical protein
MPGIATPCNTVHATEFISVALAQILMIFYRRYQQRKLSGEVVSTAEELYELNETILPHFEVNLST